EELPLGGVHDPVALLLRGALDELQWALGKQPVLDCPVKHPFDRNDRVAAATLPALVLVEPPGEGQRREAGSLGGAKAPDEWHNEVAVELVALGLGVGPGMVEEVLPDLGNCELLAFGRGEITALLDEPLAV